MKQSVDLEQTLDIMLDSYLEKHDPVKKAERQLIRGKVKSVPGHKILEQNTEQTNQEDRAQITNKSTDENTNDNTKQLKRAPFAANIKHQVNMKYQGRCGHTDTRGKRCTQTRFLEIHHKKPVSQGGSNDIDNLTLYCYGHHRMEHTMTI